ncbi:MAG: porin family protein [Lactobacillus sp.]|jgi:opacity protein-like surface antigen|nr:porin family protein [Lactobacillus sp.]
MKKFLGAVLLSSVCLAGNANANHTEYRPYIGFDYVNSDMNIKTAGDTKFGPHYDNMTLNVGTTIGNYFGTEMFAQHSDKDKRNNGRKTFFRGYGLDAIGYLPFGCDMKFALLGSFGIGEYHVHSKNKFAGEKDRTDHGIGWRTGVGAQYKFTDNWAARAMVRHVNFNSIDKVDHMIEYSAGVRYIF